MLARSPRAFGGPVARGLLGVAIAVLITLAVAASSAAAANLSAAPAGDGTPPCPIADPCDLATALGAAAAGDVVSALPGTYAVASVPVGDRTRRGAVAGGGSR